MSQNTQQCKDQPSPSLSASSRQLELEVELEQKLHEKLESYSHNLMNQFLNKERDRLRMKTLREGTNEPRTGSNSHSIRNSHRNHLHQEHEHVTGVNHAHSGILHQQEDNYTYHDDINGYSLFTPENNYADTPTDGSYGIGNGNFISSCGTHTHLLNNSHCNILSPHDADETVSSGLDVGLIKNLLPNHLNVTAFNKTHLSKIDILSDSNSVSDSDSRGSSSNAFAEPPSLGDVADDFSELSELELTFDGPMDWPEGDMVTSQSSADCNTLATSAPLLDKAAAKLLLYQGDNSDLKTVDPQTQARLEALLEAAGIGKLSTTDGKAFADPEVLRKLTSSVSCALDEAAAALTRMRAETQSNTLCEKTLAEACTEGDIEVVKRLLNEGRSVHETNDEGESLLSLACSSGYYELTEVLLRMRANVEDRGIKGDCTPLMEAASGGFVNVVRLLIAYDADVNAQSSAGHTALHHAAVGGFDEVVQVLIAAGANVEEQNENGHTPLMEAASAGHVSVAKILLYSGAGINTHSNEFKESALTLACYKGHLEMVKFLLDAGADQEHKTDEMHTALMEASMDGHVEVARLLLDSGAQVNMPADSFESPLTLAACGGHVDLASLLIERGANLEEVNDEGYTPLMEASREGHDEMVVLLLANSADVNAQTEETQETALTLACCGGFIEVAHFLIEANADIELGCSTPLMEASQEGHLELVKYLIKEGSDIQALTGTNDSALTYASENGHTDVADVLLHAGALLEHESEGGRTPLMKAARAGHLCTVQFLISKGANVNRATANNEHTVLSLACAGGHLKVVEMLLQHGADPLHKLKDGSTMLIEACKGGHNPVVNLLLQYPNNRHKAISATVSSEYPDTIPMADDLPPDNDLHSSLDLSHKATESLAGRLEQFIHKMMSQAENSSGTREEQMARKQEILEELQRVEQELKLRTQIAQESHHSLSPDLFSEHLPLNSALHPPPPLTSLSLSTSPPSSAPSHQFVEHALKQKQHEAQLQQQKEYYQAKLQLLKHQYQQKQLQLQQQRQQLLSQAAGNSTAPSDCQDKRVGRGSAHQPIPLHIALQNHLHAHHVTEGNVDDLAQALQEWDTRDRTNILVSSSVKPMPSFNLTSKHDEAFTTSVENSVSDLPLRMEELTLSDPPPSRSLADSLAALIQEKVLENSSKANGGHAEYDELTMKTLQWLQTVDAQFAEEAALSGNISQTNTELPPAAELAAKKFTNEAADEHLNTAKITKVLNGYAPAPIANIEPSSLHEHDRSYEVVPALSHPSSPLRTSSIDPNAETDSNHDTALTLACAGGHAELVRTLLSHSAHIEHRDKKGFTPLILAATAGHASVVDILLENHAEIEAQSERTKDTPLSLACSGGRYEVVEILLRRLANKEHRNVSDYTPLSLAASGGYVTIIKLLLSYGAEINSRTGSKLGISPLMLAAMNGHTAAVKLLLDMGSDINAQIETNRNTALTLACFQGRHDVVSLLVDRKANIEHRAKTGLTPLMEAASGGYVEVGRVLLDKSADVNAPPVPSSKDTALTIAADKGHYRFVELLLSRGAAVDVKNKKGNSPLWLACNGGHLDVVQLLVSNRADIDSQDNRRVTSLMTAFRKGHIKVVKWLVKHVTQFPSDQECARYIATVNDKELLKKCQQCMGIIVQAKEHQAREALKNASILLQQIETEKSREEKRKEAAARKREKKKQKRKERQAEQQSEKTSPECGAVETKITVASAMPPPLLATSPNSSEEMMSQGVQSMHSLMQSIQRKDNVTFPQLNRKQTRGGKVGKMLRPDTKDEFTDKENVTTKRNRRNKEKASSKDYKTELSHQQKSISGQGNATVEPAKITTSTSRITELDDFADLPLLPNGKPGTRHSGTKRDRPSSGINQLDSFDGSCVPAVKYSSPTKSMLAKSAGIPSPGKKKREDAGSDWKQVTNKKAKRVSVPSKLVSQLSKSLNSIREKSGAQIQFEKAEKKSAERVLSIRGSAECIRNAYSLVSSVLAKESGNDVDSQQSRRSQAPTSTGCAVSGSSGSTSTTAVSQPNGNRDSMSTIGTFNLADYLPLAQTTNPVETKIKSSHSKPDWPVRPSNVNLPVWGPTAISSGPALSQQRTNLSPQSQKLAAVRMPASQQIAPPAALKQPGDVSRQLFPESKKNPPPSVAVNSPVTSFSDLASQAAIEVKRTSLLDKYPSVMTVKVAHPSTSQLQPALVPSNTPPLTGPPMAGPPLTGPPMSGPPMTGPPLTGPQMTGPPMTGPPMTGPPMTGPPIAGPQMAGPPMTVVNAVRPYALQPPVRNSSDAAMAMLNSPRTPIPAYSPFEGQLNKPAPQVLLSTQSTNYRSSADPTKAPGFRPSVASPHLPTQFSAQHQTPSDETMFSRAPGSQLISSAEHLMAPLSSASISSNVHTLFADSQTNSHRQLAHLPYPPTALYNYHHHHHPKFVEGRRNSLLVVRDRYSTTGKPMTLPHISSSLNPNASEFTAPSRFGGDGMQHSPPANIAFQLHQRQQQPSPVELRSGSVYQPHQNPSLIQASQDPVVLRQMVAASSHNCPVSHHNMVTVKQSSLPATNQASFSPSAGHLVSPPPEAPTLSDSPTAPIDTVDRVPMDRVPMERVPMERVPMDRVPMERVPMERVPMDRVPMDRVPMDRVPMDRVPMDRVPIGSIDVDKFMSHSVFQNSADIWSADKANEHEWAMNTPNMKSMNNSPSGPPHHIPLSDGSYMPNLFKPEGAGSMANLPAVTPQYPFYTGGAGDSLQSTWNSVSSKEGNPQEWLSWEQPKNDS